MRVSVLVAEGCPVLRPLLRDRLGLPFPRAAVSLVEGDRDCGLESERVVIKDSGSVPRCERWLCSAEPTAGASCHDSTFHRLPKVGEGSDFED